MCKNNVTYQVYDNERKRGEAGGKADNTGGRRKACGAAQGGVEKDR